MLFSITVLSTTMAKANDDLFELQVESEIVTADAVFDVDAVQKSEEALQETRQLRDTSIPRLREEIRQAYVTQKWARQQIKTNEKEAAQLERERTEAQSELNKATVHMQKTDRLLKSAQGHFDRKQKSRDLVIEKREMAIKRMNQRIDASQLMVAKVEQAERELKMAELQYQKTLQLEREQKMALMKKQNHLKKRIAAANIKTNRVKSMMKKVVLGRAG